MPGMRLPDPRYVTRRVKRHIDLSTRPAHEPSFWARLRRRREIWTSLVELNGNDEEVFPEYSKLRARGLAEVSGVALPDLLDGPVHARDLRPNDYGSEFVIKPNWGTSSRGVLVLTRVQPDLYQDLVDDEILNADGVRAKAEHRVSISGRGKPDDLLVERSMAVGRARPQEWKIWVFGGIVGLIQQIDRASGHIRGRNFRSDWTPTGRIRPDRRETVTLPPPLKPDALLDAAIRVASHVPSGFVRVDLYEAYETGVPVLGEVCLIPGGDLYLGKGLDRELGQLWNDADVRLLSRRELLVP